MAIRHSLACDYKGCDYPIVESRNEFISDMRADAKAIGWGQIRFANGDVQDFCPDHLPVMRMRLADVRKQVRKLRQR